METGPFALRPGPDTDCPLFLALVTLCFVLHAESLASVKSTTQTLCGSPTGSRREGPFLKALGDGKCQNVNRRHPETGGR